MNTDRYDGEQDEALHGSKLTWPGSPVGFPIFGEVKEALLKQNELEELVHFGTFKCKMFYLWQDEDKDLFEKVMDRIVNGWFYEKRRIDIKTKQGLKVWLEWVQVYAQLHTKMDSFSRLDF